MKRLRLLCAEEEVLAHPEMMGLEGERLDALEWVLCVHGAEECRSAAESLPDSVGVWIVSCDDMDAVNLAAALKRDDPDRNFGLLLSRRIAFEPRIAGGYRRRARRGRVQTGIRHMEGDDARVRRRRRTDARRRADGGGACRGRSVRRA
mgnify:CR=1 FL=1